MKIDIALYDKDMKEHLIKDVMLSGSNEITDIPVTFDGEVTAVLLNHGCHSYTKVRFDQKSQ